MQKMQSINTYRFILDPTSRKYKCPNCGQRSFVIFIDSQTGEIMEEYGRCDRESKCGFFYHPSKGGFNNSRNSDIVIDKIEIPSPSFHHNSIVEESMQLKSDFLKYIGLLFGTSAANEVQSKYKIGTFQHFNYSTIFWQIDGLNNVRAGKIIQYFESGKRTKNISWMHKYLLDINAIKNFNLSQCLFGLHLTNDDKSSIIGLVESEKTACIMSIVFPDFLWLSCGAKGEFKLAKLSAIKDREIIAYPDCEIQNNGTSTYDEWKKKAEGFNKIGFKIYVSDLLEKESTLEQKKQGIDIADYFMKEVNGT